MTGYGDQIRIFPLGNREDGFHRSSLFDKSTGFNSLFLKTFLNTGQISADFFFFSFIIYHVIMDDIGLNGGFIKGRIHKLKRRFHNLKKNHF